MGESKKTATDLERSAKTLRHEKALKKIIPTVMAAIAILVVIVYLVSLMYTRSGSFTVSLDKYNGLKYGLSLSETSDFKKPTSYLKCRAVEKITNIDGEILDYKGLGAVDGNDSGDNYLCYTFYCRNEGTEIVSFDYSMIIANMTLDIEKAVRIRLMTSINGSAVESVDYARASGVDNEGKVVPEPGTTPFYSKTVAMLETVPNFAPRDVMKTTIVIWLEGNDPECLDNIIGGEFKVDMKMSITSTAE